MSVILQRVKMKTSRINSETLETVKSYQDTAWRLHIVPCHVAPFPILALKSPKIIFMLCLDNFS